MLYPISHTIIQGSINGRVTDMESTLKRCSNTETIKVTQKPFTAISCARLFINLNAMMQR